MRMPSVNQPHLGLVLSSLLGLVLSGRLGLGCKRPAAVGGDSVQQLQDLIGAQRCTYPGAGMCIGMTAPRVC
jgi:hypothetical protein